MVEAAGKRPLLQPVRDGLMIGVHNDPAHALSDGAQSLTYDSFHHTMNALRAVAAAVDREI